MLEVEQERETILRERLEELIGDADGWKIDSGIIPSLPPEEVAHLTRMLLVEGEPDEETKERFENDIREMREDVEECGRRQQAIRNFLDAIGE